MVTDRFITSITCAPVAARLCGDLVRVSVAAALAVVVLGALAYSYPGSWAFLNAHHFGDFGRFLYATAFFVRGADMYGVSPSTPIDIPGAQGVLQLLDLNPPILHSLFWPLMGLSERSAFTWWAAANAVLWLTSCSIIIAELRTRWTLAGMIWITAAMLASTATIATVITGQLTFTLMLPMTLAWRSIRRERWREAAIYLGALTGIKLFVAVFAVLFIARRRWDCLLVMFGTSAAVFGLGLALFGMAAHLSWLRVLTSVSWAWLSMNASVLGLVSRALDGGPVFTPVVYAPALVRPVAAAISIALSVVSVWTIAADGSEARNDRACLLLLLLSLLVSPLGWIYYFWLAAGPAVAVWLAGRTRRSRARDWLVLLAIPGLFAPLAISLTWSGQLWSGATVGSIYTWTALLLWASAIADARTDHRKTSAMLLKSSVQA